jgi:hypothetical protein
MTERTPLAIVAYGTDETGAGARGRRRRKGSEAAIATAVTTSAMPGVSVFLRQIALSY